MSSFTLSTMASLEAMVSRQPKLPQWQRLPKGFDLDVAYFTDVAVLAEKHLALGDDARSRPLVDTHQDGVHAVADSPKKCSASASERVSCPRSRGRLKWCSRSLASPRLRIW